jgi:hypothetical protein
MDGTDANDHAATFNVKDTIHDKEDYDLMP